MNPLNEGDKAPNFQGIDQDGNPISLTNYEGKKLILYFYPKDNTPTCTVESCNLRDNYTLLKQNGFEILGVSPDGVKQHQKFIKKQKLPFSLLVDEDLENIKAYGVWGEKSLFGHKYMGVLRTTFVIDEKGIIIKVINKVQAKRHSEQILKELGK